MLNVNAAFETKFGRITNIFGNKKPGRIRSNLNLRQYTFAVVGNGDDKTHYGLRKVGRGKGATVEQFAVSRS
jgi:hypothetical protein